MKAEASNKGLYLAKYWWDVTDVTHVIDVTQDTRATGHFKALYSRWATSTSVQGVLAHTDTMEPRKGGSGVDLEEMLSEKKGGGKVCCETEENLHICL